MPIRRIPVRGLRAGLLAAGLGGVLLLGGAAGGPDATGTPRSAPGAPPVDLLPGELDPQTAYDPPPPRRNSLTISDRTLLFLEGELDGRRSDTTTAALAGGLVLRAQCHDGSLAVTVTGAGGRAGRATLACDGKPKERRLGAVRVGDPLAVEITGRTGTDFAVELASG